MSDSMFARPGYQPAWTDEGRAQRAEEPRLWTITYKQHAGSPRTSRSIDARKADVLTVEGFVVIKDRTTGDEEYIPIHTVSGMRNVRLKAEGETAQ